MSRVISKRFNITKTVRDHRGTKTFVASDLLTDGAKVVVKVFRRDQFVCDRVQLERALAVFTGLRHQHIVPILEAGFTKAGDLYFIREYVESEPRPDPRSIRQLLSTVHFLNSVGYVHGGIKPSNVFLTGNELKLSDPRICDSRTPEDCKDEIRFRAPEVLNGERASPASDLYSLGALLYGWIAGEDAFEDSEMNLLRLKYMWASPKTISNNGDSRETIAHAVLGLLHKNPQRRMAAFQALLRLFETNGVPAVRSPLIGRTETLHQLRSAIPDKSKKTLRTIVIEGPPGIGKSRLVEELGITCGLDSVGVVVCHSGDDPSIYQIIRAVNRIIQSQDNLKFKLKETLGHSFDTLSRYFHDHQIQSPPPPSDPIERITSDLVGLLAVLARLTAVALVVEDIDRSDSVVIKFVEQLCVRADEVSLALVLTCRTFSLESHLGQLLGGILAGDFDHFQLKPLAHDEARSLVSFITQANADRDAVVYFSGGNPLFAEQYAANGVQALPTRVRETLDWMQSSVTDEDKLAIQGLSLFTEPIKVEVLAQVTNRNIDALRPALARLEGTGLVLLERDGVRLHPASRDEISISIPPRRRMDLNRRAFAILSANHYSAKELARWSFDGQLFSEAAAIYRAIAGEDFRNRNLRSVAFCYERVEKCSRRGAVGLSALEQSQLAQSYSNIGRVREARKLFEKLLRSNFVRNNPKLLSDVYHRLGSLYDKTKSDARITLTRKAIAELGETSEEICSHYVHLCWAMLRVGDLAGATNALENAEKHDNGASEAWLVAARGCLFLNRGEFRNALDCFKTLSGSDFSPPAVSLNVGLCFEHLGDLQKANTAFMAAERKSLRTGHIPVRVFSILNLGCVAMKLGDLAAAQRCHAEALVRIEDLLRRETEFDRNTFMSVYADITLHRIHAADFKGAVEFASRSRPKKGWVFTLDRIHCELVKCELLARLGQRKQAEAKLLLLDSNPLFRSPFFQTEKNLIQVRINGHSKVAFSKLIESLGSTEELGTSYQQCAVLNELARVCLGMNDRSRGADFAKKSLSLSQKKHYRLLGASALLLIGMASEAQAQKRRYLYSAFQEASEMGLRELVAESAYEIGAFQLSAKNWITAQEYLMRSISIIEEIAEGVPERYRSSYLSLSLHRRALQALKVCNPEVQKLLNIKTSSPDFGSEKRYFAGLYQLTAATSSVTSVDALVAAMVKTLAGTLFRSAVIAVRSGDKRITRSVKAKQSEELILRAEKFIGKTKDRIYLGATDTTPHKPMAWVPLESAIWEGGVYVVCGAHEPTFTEKEIEFLTMVGTIGNAALTSMENRRRDEAKKNIAEFRGMIGVSKAINDIFSQIQVAASNVATVLIEGESGTGKELVAKAIHSESPRVKEPFVAVDCGAIPESLIEAELFGAKKGSYTGAIADRPGLFEAGHRGTIFLDEISNTTPALQAKLLRVIQEREVRRIGETKGRPVDVRLIVASNQNLDALAEGGRFRKDLLYRLKVLHIKVPPLRNRREDIPMLAHAFVQKLNAANRTKKYLAPDVLDRLSTYSFPGNIRELQNAIERAYFSAKGTVIGKVSLEAEAPQETRAGEDVQSWFKDLSEGRKDFWSAVHNRYKRRDISREKVLAFVDFGLRSTRGNYKTMAAMLRLKEKDYRRFMDFLRRSNCLLDFRPYRKLGSSAT